MTLRMCHVTGLVALAVACLIPTASAAAESPSLLEKTRACLRKETHLEQVECLCEDVLGGTYVFILIENTTDGACRLQNGWILYCTSFGYCVWLRPGLVAPGAEALLIGANHEIVAVQNPPSSPPFFTSGFSAPGSVVVQTSPEGGAPQPTSEGLEALHRVAGEPWLPENLDPAYAEEPFAFLMDAPLEELLSKVVDGPVIRRRFSRVSLRR